MSNKKSSGLSKVLIGLILIALVGGLILYFFPQGREKAKELVSGTRTVTVVLKGEAEIPENAPVTFKKVEIGRVERISLDERNRQVLLAGIKEEHVSRLRNSSVFYVEDDRELVHEVLAENDVLKEGDLVFPGFSSHARFLAFKAKLAGGEMVDAGREIIDELLN